MMPENVDAILGVLARHPEGMVAKAAAAELGWKVPAASQRMGDLFNAGLIDRTSPPGRTCNLFLYHIKPSPPTAPVMERWLPAQTLIARRMIHV